jgi:hypothetical protein
VKNLVVAKRHVMDSGRATQTHLLKGFSVNEDPADFNDLSGVLGDEDSVFVTGGGNVDDNVAVNVVRNQGGDRGLRGNGLLRGSHVESRGEEEHVMAVRREARRLKGSRSESGGAGLRVWTGSGSATGGSEWSSGLDGG